MTAPRRQSLIAAGLYLVLAIIWCHQLFLRGFQSTLPNDLGDPLLNTWILWWNHHVWSTGRLWWNAPAFFPAEGVLSFSESLLAISLLTSPLQALGASPAAAYNTAFVFSFAASAMAAYLLCRECTGSHAAALVGGAYFGFGPHRAAHLPQLQILWAFWIPLFFYALFRYRAASKARDLFFVGVAWIGVALSSVYFLLYTAAGAVLWGLWFLANREGLGRLMRLAAVGVAATALVMPLLFEFKQWHEYYGFRRSSGEMESYSADALSVLDGWHGLWTWPNVASLDRAEGPLYPGLLTVLLLLIAAWQWWRVRQRSIGGARASQALAAVGLVLMLVGLAAAWTGGARWTLGPLALSISTPYKPMGIGSVLLVASVLLLPSVRESYRRQSMAGWWIFCAASAYVFALGPTGHVAGMRFWYKAPYAWLMQLPGFDSARVPARFGTLLALAVAVLVALAVRRLAVGPRAGWISAAAIVAVLMDGAVTISAVPLPAPVPAQSWGVDSVLEIPLDVYRDVAAMAGSMTHALPVANGYSGFAPPHYYVLSNAVEDGQASAIHELRRFGTLGVVVDPDTDAGRRWPELLAAFARPDLHAPGGRQVFVLPRTAEGSDCLARALGPQSAGPRIAAVASTTLPGQGASEVARAIDGNWSTFHTIAEPTKPGDGLVIALAREQAIDNLVLWMGPVPFDHPGALRVAARGGAGLTTVYEGEAAGLAMGGTLADPRRAPLAICFPPVSASELTLTAVAERDRPWSVAEISVMGPQ